MGAEGEGGGRGRCVCRTLAGVSAAPIPIPIPSPYTYTCMRIYMCVCVCIEKGKGKKSRKKRGNSLFRIFLIAVLLISPNRNPVNISRFILINPSNASPASFFLSFPCSPVAASFAQNSAHRSCAFSASCAEWSRSVVPKKTPCSRYIWKI